MMKSDAGLVVMIIMNEGNAGCDNYRANKDNKLVQNKPLKS